MVELEHPQRPQKNNRHENREEHDEDTSHHESAMVLPLRLGMCTNENIEILPTRPLFLHSSVPLHRKDCSRSTTLFVSSPLPHGVRQGQTFFWCPVQILSSPGKM